MNKLLILTSYTKFELNSLRNNEITMKLLIKAQGGGGGGITLIDWDMGCAIF